MNIKQLVARLFGRDFATYTGGNSGGGCDDGPNCRCFTIF